MSEDAATGPGNEADGDIFTTAARRRFCVLTLLLGATVGILVGILNFMSANYEWSLQEDFFDIVDAPIGSLMSAPYGMFSIFYTLKLGVVVICYWEVISLFLASLVCLVYICVIRDIIRDKICRYVLFFGACVGIFVGSLAFLAASNGWNGLDNIFNFFERPVDSMMSALQGKYNFLDSLPPGPGAEFIIANIVDVIYWTLIGLLAALLPCVVRILKRRKAAREKQVVSRMIALCRSGAPEEASRQGPTERQSV